MRRWSDAQLDRFFAEETRRPAYVWENFEDLIYHDRAYSEPRLADSPELAAFLHRVWVFNRALEWHDCGDCLVCYGGTGDLYLTGEQQVSRWHSGSSNLLAQNGERTSFSRLAKRRRDCTLLPALQIHLGQHPRCVIDVTEANADWQLCVGIKGRSGPPLLSTGWQSQPGQAELDLTGALTRRGYGLSFAELHFALGTWSIDADESANITFRLTLPGHAALISCLPMIRTERRAAEGIPIAAVALDEHGDRLSAKEVGVHVRHEERWLSLTEQEGFWTTNVPGLRLGDHSLELRAEGAIQSLASVKVHVRHDTFFTYDSTRHLLERDGLPTGPVSGSFQGTFFFRDVGRSSEGLVQGQTAWDAWDRESPPGEHLHYWEALTESELEGRFAHLADCGFDVLHLHQHWGVWSRLDAGGRIAPHGAEQLALYLSVAARHGLAVIQALSSYPYGVERKENRHAMGTPPFSRYIELGFTDEDWFDPSRQPFTDLFHGYLRDFVNLFREETALLGVSASGEGDYLAPARVNDTYRFLRSLNSNHLFLCEPILAMSKLPAEHLDGFEPMLAGGRTYFIGEEIAPEFDLGVEFKLMQLGRVYMAEGSWPHPLRYVRLNHRLGYPDGSPDTWTGTLRYRNRLRDSLYLALVHRLPLALTWDEAVAEDEHRVFQKVRQLVDWRVRFEEPDIVLRIDATNVTGAGRMNLAQYEEYFARVPVAYRVWTGQEALDPNVEFDARQPFRTPDVLHGVTGPLAISAGYCASYAWSTDHATLLAYVYNCTRHIEHKQRLTGTYHREPEPTKLAMLVDGPPSEDTECRVFDLNNKELVAHTAAHGGTLEFDLGDTDHDYFILVRPKQ